MSQQIWPYTLNGIVKIGGVQFWRIDDLSADRTGIDFARKPAALVLADVEDDDPVECDPLTTSKIIAEKVCQAMNEIAAKGAK